MDKLMIEDVAKAIHRELPNGWGRFDEVWSNRTDPMWAKVIEIMESGLVRFKVDSRVSKPHYS